MKQSYLIFGVVLAVASGWVAACENNGLFGDVPSQSYANPLEVLGEDAGGMRGQVLFPSEYSQRSVTILVDGRTFVTHPDGRFRIEWIPPGSHQLSLHVKGFEFINRSFQLEPDASLLIEPLKLNLARGTVLGRLVYDNGKSASDISLQLKPLGGITASDNDGIFQFIGVNSGEHLLTVQDSDFLAEVAPFELKPGEKRNLGLIHMVRRLDKKPGAMSLFRKEP